MNPCPKPTPESETEKRTRRIASLRNLQAKQKPIPRKKKLSAGGSPEKRRPPRKCNPKRRKSEFARAYGSEERVAWVRGQTCIVQASECRGQPIENAHTTTGGMGRKADAKSIVPLCRLHHRELHQGGGRTFAAKYRLSLTAAAARIEREWQWITDREAARSRNALLEVPSPLDPPQEDTT